MKKTITLDTADPVSILGPGNRILNEFCTYYPSLEVSGKGNEIQIDGPGDKIADFEEKLAQLVSVRKHKLNLTIYDVEDLFAGHPSSSVLAEHGNAVIVYTNEGKAIRARNANQEKMVKAYFSNDLVFAVGPAGTGKTYTAFQIVYRLLTSGVKRKVPYLADRNNLVDQSIQQDFSPLEKVIHKVNFAKDKKDTITAYQVYFALYQQLIGDNDQEHYSELFDPVIRISSI